MRLRAALLAALASLVASAAASAALPFAGPCPDSNFECARLTVPLDRSGSIPGTIDLYVERQPAEQQPAVGAVIALAGGPGQGATSLTEDFNRDLFGNIGQRDLIVLDQRGTGRSGALSCPALERPDDRPIDERTAQCADMLGHARHFFTTAATVEDVETLRAALGHERISLLGVSYGTKVAVAYAMAHPDRVERLVLDSVVDPVAEDPFGLEALASLPRILGEICRDECEDITTDLAADVAALVDQMPVSARFVTRRGKRVRRTIGARDLFRAIRASDTDPALRAELPAAVRAAVVGDPAALVRMEHRFAGLPELEPPPGDELVRALSFTLQAATLCEEEAFPWDESASPEERDRQAEAAAAAIPPERFEPFDRETVLARDSDSLLFQCRRWPAGPPRPVLGGALPDVPVLAFAGLVDTRTTAEAANRVASRFPRAQVVLVPKAGHAVLGGRACAAEALRLFFADTPVGNPCLSEQGPPLVPLAPASVGSVGVVKALLMTLDDLAREHARRLFGPRRGGGLRAGYFAQRRGLVHVRAWSFVTKMAVSGVLKPGLRDGRLTVGGRHQGALRLRDGRLIGALGGVRVATRWEPPALPLP